VQLQSRTLSYAAYNKCPRRYKPPSPLLFILHFSDRYYSPGVFPRLFSRREALSKFDTARYGLFRELNCFRSGYRARARDKERSQSEKVSERERRQFRGRGSPVTDDRCPRILRRLLCDSLTPERHQKRRCSQSAVFSGSLSIRAPRGFLSA